MKLVILLKVVKILLKTTLIVIFVFVLSTALHVNVLSRHKRFDLWRPNYTLQSNKLRTKTKYILIWTKGDKNLDCLKSGRDAFVENNCKYDNCYVTLDRNLLDNDYTNFDSILIDGKAISVNKSYILPEKRSPKQLYIFANKDSAENYPVCDKRFDSFFNLTWTHRLDSDAKWTYFTIYNNNNEAIGPKRGMNWINYEGDGVNYDLISHIGKKQRTAIWFVSNCFTKGGRETIVGNLNFVLQDHQMSIEVVGKCGKNKCPKEDETCIKMLEEYFFYIAFENSVAEDYVTDIVLKALWNYVVPVVYGGINYTNFLPPDSYIDAENLTYEETAQKMMELIRNKSSYLEYFKWRKYYRYSKETKSVCELCAAVNRNGTVYRNFRSWWYPVYDMYDICGDKNLHSY